MHTVQIRVRWSRFLSEMFPPAGLFIESQLESSKESGWKVAIFTEEATIFLKDEVYLLIKCSKLAIAFGLFPDGHY